jgi:hypothetical protein
MQTKEVPREYAFFGSAQFDDPVRAAGRKAFSEPLAAGLPVLLSRRRRDQCHGVRRWPKI